MCFFRKCSIFRRSILLNNRCQATKVNPTCSDWIKLDLCIPQRSVLGHVTYTSIFYIIQDAGVCNYADNTTIYSTDTSLSSLIHKLKHDAIVSVEWFQNNYMQYNQENTLSRIYCVWI